LDAWRTDSSAIAIRGGYNPKRMAQGAVVKMCDAQGHWAEYRYDAKEMLTDTTLSSDHARHYSYDGE
jgi:hypothetical protein